MPRLQQYVRDVAPGIHGWVNPATYVALQACHEMTALRGDGGACEIGVHHGKFFLALMACVSAQVKSLAIDLFDDQQFNVDRSGRGVRSIFEENVLKYVPNPDSVEILQCDSLDFGVDRITKTLAESGRFRLFSVDGGHTATHAANDIMLAQKLTLNSGVIIVDDFFHPHWPGVTEGVYKYLRQADARFVPLLLSGRKLYMASFSYHDAYRTEVERHLRGRVADAWYKGISIEGHSCLAFELKNDRVVADYLAEE